MNQAQRLFAVKEVLELDGWTMTKEFSQVLYDVPEAVWVVAHKHYETYVNHHHAHIWLFPSKGDDHIEWTVRASFESQGRNIVDSVFFYLREDATQAEIQQLMRKFCDELVWHIDNSFARSLYLKAGHTQPAPQWLPEDYKFRCAFCDGIDDWHPSTMETNRLTALGIAL